MAKNKTILAKLYYKHGGILYMQVDINLKSEKYIRVGNDPRLNQPYTYFSCLAEANQALSFVNHGVEELFGQPTLILKQR